MKMTPTENLKQVANIVGFPMISEKKISWAVKARSDSWGGSVKGNCILKGTPGQPLETGSVFFVVR